MKRPSWGTLSALALLPLAAGAFMLQQAPVSTVRNAEEGARLFAQVLRHVQSDAVDSLKESEIYERAARGLVESLNDPYADLYSPAQLAAFQRNTLGNNYAGVGMQIENQNGLVTVVKVFPGTPGEAAGILAGDRILRVDSVDVQGMALDLVSNRLTGRPGTKVEVTLGRQGVPEPLQVTVTRAVIRVPAVPVAIQLDHNIGYISLQRFNESASEDVLDALQRLRRGGATSFVLDVRGNPGGSLDQALEIVDLFLPPGQEIAHVRHRGKEAEAYFSRRPSMIDSLSLVVLVDAGSASASEIVAGSLQDHDRALVIGTPSYGKGLVQTLFPLEDGWAIKLTTGKWYTPSGRSIQGEHKQLADGRFVEYAPDTLESDSTKHQRPAFHSDGGRVIYGGGGVTPDLIVRSDTATTAEQSFLKAIAPKAGQAYLAVYGFALEQKATVTPSFVVLPAWRDEIFKRFRAAGIEMDRATFDGGRAIVDAWIDQRVATLAFGDSTMYRRSIPNDAQLRSAIEMLRRGASQRDLLARAALQESKRSN